MLLRLLAVCYFMITAYTVWQSSLPFQPCSDGRHCFAPSTRVGDQVQIQLYIRNHTKWVPIESCSFNVTIPIGKVEITSNETTCEVVLPAESRIRWSKRDAVQGRPLAAKFRVRSLSHSKRILTEATFSLTRIKDRSWGMFESDYMTRERNLLEGNSEPTGSDRNEHAFVPYLKYNTQSVLLRFVGEDRLYGGPPPLYRNDGMPLSPLNSTSYRPRFYVDENSLTHSQQLEMAPPELSHTKPPISIRIQLSTLSPLQDSLNRQLTEAMKVAEQMFSGSELDEIRYWLRDERLYRFALTQLISFVHIWLEYLAFSDEIRFYRGRTNFAGVSVSSVLTRLLCSLIIFLYLLDGGGTSWVVLASIFSGVVVDAWKAGKLLKPGLKLSPPFVVFRHVRTEKEQTTAEYDRIAVTYLSYFLYPIVIGWAIYSLRYEEYKSWWSWFISNAANGVYTFGFIALCPQLYVNYRLKSVAHLPWKVFVYKIFTTFVDDVFAFLIDMPWKHRVMTLRDDVVFVLFLVQVYMYRVDKTRTNEYGFAYEESADSTSDKPPRISSEGNQKTATAKEKEE